METFYKNPAAEAVYAGAGGGGASKLEFSIIIKHDEFSCCFHLCSSR